LATAGDEFVAMVAEIAVRRTRAAGAVRDAWLADVDIVPIADLERIIASFTGPRGALTSESAVARTPRAKGTMQREVLFVEAFHLALILVQIELIAHGAIIRAVASSARSAISRTPVS